jgi:hypothetical protein
VSTDPIQLLIQAGAISSDPYAENSRYRGIPQSLYIGRAGDRAIRYLLRRFIPQKRDISIAAEHIVQSGERPDLLAMQMLGDAELYWRIADANAVIDPHELVETLGARVLIPRPTGL